jgi:hypothetical protein
MKAALSLEKNITKARAVSLKCAPEAPGGPNTFSGYPQNQNDIHNTKA